MVAKDPSHSAQATVPLVNIISEPPASMSLQRVLATYQDRLLIAISPAESDDIDTIFAEVEILCILPTQRGIITPPVALTIISNNGIFRYLRRKGNLRDYTLHAHKTDALHMDLLRKWAVQIATVLRSLLYKYNIV